MAILLVPGDELSITAAMNAASDGDTIVVAAGEDPEIVLVTKNNITIDAPASVVGIELTIDAGVIGLTLAGDAPIDVMDSNTGDIIIGNAGDNTITVTGGIDTVDGGAGDDRLVVDYSSSSAAITGTVASIGSAIDKVQISGGSIEHYTVLTGSGIDGITLGDGKNYIDAGKAYPL
jgi:hypothetical protein